MALEKKRTRRLRPRPYRLLLVTFDLVDTGPDDARYSEADQTLAVHGEVFNPFKELRLLITRSSSKNIKADLEQRIGRDASILVAPLRMIPAWRIHGAEKRQEWRRFVRAVESHEIEIAALEASAVNPD